VERERDPVEYLASGDAWRDFCRELAEAGAEILRDTAPKAPIDLAEGHRHLARMLRAAFEQILEAGDAAKPWLFGSLHETLKSGWDNPDNHHTNAYISGAYDYRVWGRRGDAHLMSFAVYGGSLGRGGGRRTVAYKTLDELGAEPDGRFELFLSMRPQPRSWLPTAEDATTLMVRETFWDKARERRAELHIERVGGEGAAPLTPDFVVSALARSLRFVQGSNRLFFDLADAWRARPNTFFPGDPALAASTLGIPNQFYGSGWWRIGPDEAIVLDVAPPVCRYWSLVLSDYWGGSFDYRYWQVHTNQRRAVVRPDGSVRMVVSHRDPGIEAVNWLDTAGHSEGVWTVRWLEAAEHPLPEVRVVRFADLRWA
jgi:hypothetical protein